MSTLISRIGLSLVAFVALAFGSVARAQDAVKVTASDFGTCEALRLDAAIKENKLMFAHKPDAKKAVEDEWQAALAKAGWNQEKFDTVNDAISQVADALDQQAKGGDEAAAAKETLDAADKETVATVKAHKAERRASNELSQKAVQLMREQQDAEKRGTPPTAKDLEGTWTMDLDATVALMSPIDDPAVREQMKKSMAEAITSATYTFGPGDAMTSTTVRKGATSTEEGTYRLDGSKLLVKARNSKREHEMAVGMKDGALRIGMMGMYTVFKKQ